VAKELELDKELGVRGRSERTMLRWRK